MKEITEEDHAEIMQKLIINSLVNINKNSINFGEELACHGMMFALSLSMTTKTLIKIIESKQKIDYDVPELILDIQELVRHINDFFENSLGIPFKIFHKEV